MIIGLAGLLMIMVNVVTIPQAAADDQLDRRDVDRAVAAYLKRQGLPGAAVAIVKNGEPVYQQGYSRQRKSITADTAMGVGSVTKMFTAFAVLQLVDTGRIGLDDPVVERLPEFTMDDPRAARITVRELLSHTSGMPNPTLVPPARTAHQGVTDVRALQLQSDPGSRFSYSNLNYHVAARLIEVVADQPFDSYLSQHIFRPLGMDDTRSVSHLTGATPGVDDGHLTAYGTWLPLREMTHMTAGAGSVISTAHDMGLWLALQQRGGVTSDGTRLLSEKLIKESHHRQPGAANYGLGWQHTQTSEPARVGHDGQLTRYSARVDLVPSSGYGIVVLTNSYTPTYSHPFEISSQIIALTEHRTPRPGMPVATIIDAVLGLLTLGVVAATLRGLLRSRRWVSRRQHFPGWRFGLRMIPQLIMPGLVILLFGVLPLVHDNSATAVDVFGLWPAAMVLLLTAGAAGVVMVATRSVRRVTTRVESA